MPGARSTLRAATVAGAGVLGVVGALLVAAAVDRPSPEQAGSPGTSASSVDRAAPAGDVDPRDAGARRQPRAAGADPDRTTGVRDLVAGPTLPESMPVRVEIPRIGVASRVVGLGLDAAGRMEVPQVGEVAGWYTKGPTPGALGPAVIAGHIDWEKAPAVFFRLHTMRRGDRVEVARADGSTAVFTVTRVASFPKEQFPTAAVFGSTDHAGLRLITCGGAFDASTRHYLRNVVVFARLVER